MVDQEILLQGHTAGEAGMSEYQFFHLEDKLTKVVDQILKGDQDVFPVVNESNDCVAVLSFDEVIYGIEKRGPDAMVKDAVHQVPEQIAADSSAFDALQTLIRSKLPGAAIVDENGHLSKWLTVRQFREFMMIKALSKSRLA